MTRRISLSMGLGASILVAAAAVALVRPSTPLAAAATGAAAQPPEKQALRDAEASFQATAPRADKHADPGRPADAGPDSAPDTGLLGPVNAPYPGEDFTPENAWSGWTDPTTFTQVWAGQAPNNPGHGVILIVRRPGASGRLVGGAAPTLTLLAPPALAGPLHIVRVEGADLIVANPGGQEFRFNPVAGALE